MSAVVERAFRIGTITASQRRYLHIQLARAGYKLREPYAEEIPIEKPELLDELLNIHRGSLGYSHEELSKLLWYFTEEDFRSDLVDRNRLRLVG